MPVQIKEGTYYTIPEAAKELNVSDKSVRDYIHEGRLEAVNLQGRVLIAEEDLMTFKANFTKWEKTR